MLTVDVRKISESFLPNIAFILNEISENGITFVWIGLSLKIKKLRNREIIEKLKNYKKVKN